MQTSSTRIAIVAVATVTVESVFAARAPQVGAAPNAQPNAKVAAQKAAQKAAPKIAWRKIVRIGAG